MGRMEEDSEAQLFIPIDNKPILKTTAPLDGPLLAVDSITFSWKDVTVSTVAGPERRCCGLLPTRQPANPAKHILHGVSGVARPGELLAIMGASGAGKSTLLNTLTFRNLDGLQVSGSRICNNQLVTPTSLTSLSAYVQQDDLFIGTLTVKEHLTFQALVRMDKHISLKERMRRIDQVVDEMGLGGVVDTLIGIKGRIKGISGGESKRLALASELLTNPFLMFCDEPTSGLDAFMAASVVEGLKKLALKGRTVVCTIHQPSSQIFSMFDSILLMAEGKTAWLGTPNDAYDFFSSCGHPCPLRYNPADHFVQVLAVVRGEEENCRENIELICSKYEQSVQGKELAELVQLSDKAVEPEVRMISPYKASWWAQFKALTWRNWLSVLKEPMILKARVAQNVLMGLILGAVYFGQGMDQAGVMNINGALFLFIIHMTFTNMFGVVNVFCAELPIFLREHFSGMYRTDTYFLSKQLAELPVFLLIPIIFVVIMYFMVGLNLAADKFFVCLGIIELVVQVVVSFGYFISCVAPSVQMALGIAPAILMPLVLFGGFFLNNATIPSWLAWIKWLSWFKYSNSALLINQWTGVDHISCPSASTNTSFAEEASSPCISTGEQVISHYSFQEDTLWFDIVMLVVLAVSLRILAFLALLKKTFRKKT